MTEIKQKYYELYIKINPQIEDDVANICFEHLDCEGVLMEEQKFKDLEMTETSKGTLKVFLRSLITPEFDDVCEFIKLKRQEMKETGFTDEELGSWDCALLEKENEDWSKKWKENWDVTHITDKVVVVPSWIDYQQKENEIIISLDPGCAFGTGTHQTTQIPVKCIEKYVKKGDRVADIGMGSGILGIIAKKFGAEYVYGCDIDETVIDVAKENALKNNVKCTFELGTIDNVNEQFDFVCANILHNVLADIMGDLKNIMKPNGKMVLSGIMDNKKQVVLDAIEREHLNIQETLYQDQWVGYLVTK
ncbi:MAG: 50S ribosomal protein L11 methyltransferase [Candidatus Gastranaerophilales bacterium]|nr:50S ribosomal protein L11 methyltransferase [Candidatus Gastranaerophilales bacterium]